MGSPGHSGAAWDPVFSLRWRNLVRSHSHLHASCSPGLGAADTQAGPSAAPEPTVDRSPPFSGPYCPYLQNERLEDQGREMFVHSVGVQSLTLPVGLSVCRGHEMLTNTDLSFVFFASCTYVNERAPGCCLLQNHLHLWTIIWSGVPWGSSPRTLLQEYLQPISHTSARLSFLKSSP